MEQEKIYDQIKSAAQNSETKDFHAMDKVWNRVEEKLDQKVLKKEKKLWKKIAVAASVLLVITLGYQLFKSNPKSITPQNQVVTIDTSKTILPEQNAVVANDSVNPIIKKEALKILEKQIATQAIVAASESIATDTIKDKETLSNGFALNDVSIEKDDALEKKTKTNHSIEVRKASAVGVKYDYSKNKIRSNQKTSSQTSSQKLDPLLIVDDKVSKEKLSDLDSDEIDSIMYLKEPLYIINKVYYTELEMFGPNPTSPYAPLNEQDIESFTILQPEKAASIYGEKGKKGVVIVTTKNGKPKKAK
jgi:TonB-dependent SusC/RagA subfamily outer membrane receptor